MSYWPLLICLVTTFYFIGLIWIIQIVHYPLFAYVGTTEFTLYHSEHGKRISTILGLPVLLTLLSALWMFWQRPAPVPLWAVIVNFVCACTLWILTAYLFIPLHRQLGKGYAAHTVDQLVQSNWLRTFLWTAQGVFLLWLTAKAVGAI